MGGSVNLQGGGQYQTPNIQGYGQAVSGVGRGTSGFERGIRDSSYQDYGIPPGYDAAGLGMNYSGNYGGNYSNYGGYGGYGNVSTGGKGFQQQPSYQPAPVMQPYVDQVSSGGKGMRSTPSQSVAYAPMNIPQMQLAQPGFYYPNIGSQMANMNANYGMGGLGAMGAFGNYPMMPRQPAPMQMYPALQPVAPPPTSTGGKGFRANPPSLPSDRRPTRPSIPPVSTGGKGFQPNQPVAPDTPPMVRDVEITPPIQLPTGGVPQDDTYLRPVAPGQPSQPPQSIFVPGYTGPTGNFSPNQPSAPSEERYTRDEPQPEIGNERIDYTPNNPMYAQPTSYQPQYAVGQTQSLPVEATSPVQQEPYYQQQLNAQQNYQQQLIAQQNYQANQLNPNMNNGFGGFGGFGGLGSLGGPTGLPPPPPSMPVHEAGQNYQQNFDRYRKEMQDWQSQTGMTPDEWYAQRDENMRQQNELAATLPAAASPEAAQGQAMQSNRGLLGDLFRYD